MSMDLPRFDLRAEHLAAPIYRFARSTPIVTSQDSLARAATLLRESPFTVLPFMEDGQLTGILTEASLIRKWLEGVDDTASASLAAEDTFLWIPGPTPAAEALAQIQEVAQNEAIITDPAGRVIGIVSLSDFLPKPTEMVHPGLVGGMATPFGVYLTNGAVRAGASDLALVATGMLLFTLLFAANSVGEWLLYYVPEEAPPLALDAIAYGVPMVLFLFLLRMIPLAGIHAAEHQVVHAIERGEALTVANVRRMPRVHPRCGTNIAAGLTIFLGLFSAPWIPWEEARLLIAGFTTLFFWRAFGSLLQQYVTTKPANEKQLQMGIRAGTELLDKFSRNRRFGVNPFARIYASGMLHVMLGSFICYGIVSAAAFLLGVPINL